MQRFLLQKHFSYGFVSYIYYSCVWVLCKRLVYLFIYFITLRPTPLIEYIKFQICCLSVCVFFFFYCYYYVQWGPPKTLWSKTTFKSLPLKVKVLGRAHFLTVSHIASTVTGWLGLYSFSKMVVVNLFRRCGVFLHCLVSEGLKEAAGGFCLSFCSQHSRLRY